MVGDEAEVNELDDANTPAVFLMSVFEERDLDRESLDPLVRRARLVRAAQFRFEQSSASRRPFLACAASEDPPGFSYDQGH